MQTIAYSEGDVTFQRMQSYLQAKGLTGKTIQSDLLLLQGIYEYNISLITDDDGPRIEEPETIFIKQKLRNCQKIFPILLCRKLIADKRKQPLTKKQKKRALPFLRYGLKQVKGVLASENETEKRYILGLCSDILYSIFSQSYESRRLNFQEIISFPFRKYRTWLPMLSSEGMHRPLGLKKARKESPFLVSPQQSENDFVSMDTLATMTSEEISDLDVRTDHQQWYSVKALAQISDPWLFFEQGFEDKINKQLESQFDSKRYKLNQVRRLVFFERFEDSGGTHAKIKVKDAYGFKWKLKWGNESYTESVANHLYLELGGKHQDLNYSHSIDQSILVVFPKSVDPSDTQFIDNFESLNTKVRKSRYKEDLSKYLTYNQYGTLQNYNIDDMIRPYRQSIPKHLLREKLELGMAFAVFKEASMEFKDRRIIQRGGPWAQSSPGAIKDRPMRAQVLFNIFVENFDAKDANGELVLSPINDEIHHLLQAPVDLGAAFRGDVFRRRGINGLSEKSFLTPSWLFPKHLVYNHPVAYRAKSHDRATFADLLWMAKKIARLKDDRLDQIVTFSELPDFCQKMLSYKLKKRRDHIAHLFGIKADDQDKAQSLQNIVVDLSSKSAQRRAAKKYHIPYAKLRKMLIAANVEANYYDHPVENGKIASCRNSAIINLLEKYVHPLGLSRNSRHWNRKQRPCHFKATIPSS